MKEYAETSPAVDQGRRELCRLIVRGCEQAASNIKVRVNLVDGRPTTVWAYAHIDDQWQKLPATIVDPPTAAVAADELNRLASAARADEWSLRRQDFADRLEAEIKFHREDINSHLGENLESYLFGLLFYEPKAAKKSRRSSIRRGPKAHVAR